MTDAERISALEERVSYLERELGLSLSQTQLARLVSAGMQRCQAHVVLALYQARGRILSAEQLDDTLPSGDREPRNFIKVVINRARVVLGTGQIETVRGVGYRMSGTGLKSLERLLAA